MAGQSGWLKWLLGAAMIWSGTHAMAEGVRGQWLTNVDEALQLAHSQQRPVVVFVSMDGCHYCTKMAQSTLVDPRIQHALQQSFITVAIKGADYPELMKNLKVRSFPTTLMATSDGQIFDKLTGYTDAAKFQTHLQAAWQREQQLQTTNATAANVAAANVAVSNAGVAQAATANATAITQATQPPAPVQTRQAMRRAGGPFIRR